MAGRAQDAGTKLPIASCCTPWNVSGTLAALGVPAATLSWAISAPPATAKEA